MLHRRIITSSLAIALAIALPLLRLPDSYPATTRPAWHPRLSGALGAVPLRARPALTGTDPVPPSDATCRAADGVPCYSPQEVRRAYGVSRLLRDGDDGTGETIVIVDSFGSPTIAADLATFDAGYGLPAPPSLTVLAPLGTTPFDPGNADMVTWAFETTIDVDWAHAMAPAARIVLLTSPVDETQGVQGLPQFDALERFALRRHLGQVISQSWDTAENTLLSPAGRTVLRDFAATFASAAAAGVTMTAAAGDTGSANVQTADGSYYPFPTVTFPSASPLVTAVGGTSLHATVSGEYQSESVWNDGYGAGGGGISQVFDEPWYQRLALPRDTQRQLAGHRGLPDVAWNADVMTSILVYISFLTTAENGYYFAGGTSEGAPQWAGVIADLDQRIGRPIGLLNPYLYALGAAGRGFRDVTAGGNAFAGVPGYQVVPGWDPASGWGSPDATRLVADIVRLARDRVSGPTLLARARALHG